MAWFACLQDVLPVLTGMNVLFQSKLPMPHLLHGRLSADFNKYDKGIERPCKTTAIISKVCDC